MEVAVVIDNGSQALKAGFAREEEPQAIVPSVLGTLGDEESFVGSQAQERRDVLALEHPIKRGVITDWEAIEKLWSYVFRERLEVDTQTHPVLLTEAALNSRANREKMAEVIFERFNVPATYIGLQPLMSLYASGRTSGLVLESGEDVTSALAVYQGYAVGDALRRLDFAGGDLTDNLAKSLGVADVEVARQIKEQLCFVASEAQSNVGPVDYELPDGSKVVVGDERFLCPEAVFRPSLAGLSDGDGLQSMVHTTIGKCELDLRKELYANVVLSGGNTLFRGFVERVKSEISAIAASKVRIVASEERKYAAWLGGSMLSCLSSMERVWILRSEYDESGASIVHMKPC